MKTFRRRFLVITLGLAVILAVTVTVIAYTNSPKKEYPLIFSDRDDLLELYHDSMINTIEPKTSRTLDKQQQNISTSEGQSYTMLRAVYVDDQKQYDASLQWAKDNLQRDDKLFSWKFGRLPNGTYSILDNVGGQNTATDGDSDIALSLLLAYSRWREDKYLYDAKSIIKSMWEKEVVTINDRPVLVANDLERNNPNSVVINPSYFSPYAYRLFAEVDPKHDWKGLIDNSYAILAQLCDAPLDYIRSSGLPPDWVVMDRKTGQFRAPDASSLQTTDFGYDAMRIPFRLALDYNWYKEERAKQTLTKFTFLEQEWDKNNQLLAVYKHDGTPRANYEAPPAIYGGVIGYFTIINPGTARNVYRSKLSTLYSPDEQKWKTELGYYDDNWAWFGIGIHRQIFKNLSKEL